MAVGWPKVAPDCRVTDVTVLMFSVLKMSRRTASLVARESDRLFRAEIEQVQIRERARANRDDRQH